MMEPEIKRAPPPAEPPQTSMVRVLKPVGTVSVKLPGVVLTRVVTPEEVPVLSRLKVRYEPARSVVAAAVAAACAQLIPMVPGVEIKRDPLYRTSLLFAAVETVA
jgi:hypothetical protein